MCACIYTELMYVYFMVFLKALILPKDCMPMCLLHTAVHHTYTVFYTVRLRNAQDQLIHLKHEDDELNKVLDEDETQINKITELISVVEMWVELFLMRNLKFCYVL